MSIKSSDDNRQAARRRKYGAFCHFTLCLLMFSQRRLFVLILLVLIPILFAQGAAGQSTSRDLVVRNYAQFPVGVQRMHGEILRAARSGEIERLREVLQLNELMPLINGKFMHDPVKVWKGRSKQGRKLLAVLAEILELPPVKKSTKNGVLYIWPYFAGVSLKKLEPPEIVRLYRLAPLDEVATMLRTDRYSHAVLTLGADGTWHSFEDHARPQK